MSIIIDSSEYYSVNEISSILGIDKSTVYHHAKKGLFGERIKYNRSFYYLKEKVDAIQVHSKIQIDKTLYYTQAEVLRFFKMHNLSIKKMFTLGEDYIEIVGRRPRGLSSIRFYKNEPFLYFLYASFFRE